MLLKKIVLALIGLIYVASPYDMLPDFIVGLGWVDDIVVLILLWKAYQYYLRRKYDYSREYRQTSSSETQQEHFYGNEHFGNSQQAGNTLNKKDPYEVLGVGKNASQDQIKSAYRLLVAKYHPDKVSHLGKEFRELAELRFKEIQEAYDELRVE
jgi:DnaJ like chaperone protein